MYGVNICNGEDDLQDITNDAIAMCEKLIKDLKE